MANVINTGDQNWTANWAPVEIPTVTRSALQATTLTNVLGAVQVGSSNTAQVDAVVLWGQRLTGIGTITINIKWGLGDAFIIINAADLPPVPGMVMVPIGSTLTMDTTNTWRIGIQASSAGNAQFYRDATANNWCKMLRVSNGTVAPVSTDKRFICGLGLVLPTVYTVTMDNNSAVGTQDTASYEIGNGGVLKYGTAASTNYHLGTTLSPSVWPGGVLEIGSSTTPIPASSSAIYEHRTAAGILTLEAGATLRTGGQIVVSKTRLAANVAAAGTSLTTEDETNWPATSSIAPAGTSIAIASTSLTQTQCESVVMSGAASGVTVPVGAVAFAHAGTGGYQAEVILLDRNVRLQGGSAALPLRIAASDAAIIDCQSTEFKWCGNVYVVDCVPETADLRPTYPAGSWSFSNCCVHTTSTSATDILNLTSQSAQHPCSITVTDMTSYNTSGSAILPGTTEANRTLASITVTGWWHIRTNVVTTPVWDFTQGTLGNWSFDDLVAVGSDIGFAWGDGAANTVENHLANFGALTAHSCAVGSQFSTNSTPGAQAFVINLDIGSFNIWRNANGIVAPADLKTSNIRIGGGTIKANTAANILLNDQASKWVLNNVSILGGTTPTSPIGISIGVGAPSWELNNCTFSGHTTADISGSTIANTLGSFDLACKNCTFGSATEWTRRLTDTSQVIKSLNHDGTNDNHKVVLINGTITSDASVKRSGDRSEKILYDTTTTIPLRQRYIHSGRRHVVVNAGDTPTVGVYVTCTSGYGAVPNAVYPKLYQITPGGENLIDTATIASESGWELLSGVVTSLNHDGVVELEVRVYPSDNVKAVWVDDWQKPKGAARDGGGGDYWYDGYPVPSLLPIVPVTSVSIG